MQLRKTIPSVLAAFALAAVAGCSTGTADRSTPELPASTAQQAPAGDDSNAGNTNERGNVEKKTGEEFTVTAADETAATAAVDSITPDYRCTSPYAEDAENGHYVALGFRVSVASDAPQMALFSMLNPNDFKVVKADGVTSPNLATMNASACEDQSKALPMEYQPGSKYTGTMVLDSPVAHGTIVYRPSGFDNGVEWKF